MTLCTKFKNCLHFCKKYPFFAKEEQNYTVVIYFHKPIKTLLSKSQTGLPDFSWYKIPKREKIWQIATNYTKCPLNITKDRKIGPSVHKIYQHLPLQDPPKFTQIWIFGLKTNHLTTLVTDNSLAIKDPNALHTPS
jgi:hypothetical protein